MSQPGHQFYREEDAEEILKLAATMAPEVGSMSRERLLETAAELGIPPEAVEQAEQQLRVKRAEQAELSAFEEVMRREYYGHLASYLIVNAFLCGINIYMGGFFWVIFPLLGWGTVIGFGAVETFVRTSDSYQEEFQKWREKKNRVEAPLQSVNEPLDFFIERYVQNQRARGKKFSKLEMIKHVRVNSGVGLKEAKEAVESFDARNPGLFDENYVGM